MSIRSSTSLPSLVIFEGVDGVGKTSLVEAFVRYCHREFSEVPVASGAFPGSEPGSLGEWVYRLHHGTLRGFALKPIAPPALQLLHVAAHVDAITSWIAPALEIGCVILDRYWWSTYAYARLHLDSDVAWALVSAEHPFWLPLPRPTIIYLTRAHSLKEDELDSQMHDQLRGYYCELINRERLAGVEVHELANDGELDDCWSSLLAALGLPYQPI